MKSFLLLKSILRNLLFISILFFGFSVISCSNQENNLDQFLSKMETRYEQIAFELGDAYWNFYSAEAEADLKAPKEKFYNLLVNDTLNNLIEEWYPKRSEIKDTILRERVNKWHRVLLSAKVEYDAEIMKLRNELEEKFEVSEKEDKSNYNFENNILKLIELRNKKSVELGFDNYVHLSMETNGLGYEWFLEFVEMVDKSSLEAYKSLVEKTKEESKLYEFGQMDAYQLFSQFYKNYEPTEVKIKDNIELVKTSLNNIGIDYDELPAKLVEMKLPPGIGGQGLMINIPNDFRAVMTLGMDISVWMHEMGHGLHGLYNNINSPILEGYEWVPGNANGSFAEGMAETLAWFTRNIEWQKKYTNLSEEKIIERKNTVKEYVPAYIRFHLYRFMTETMLYLQPDKKFNEIQKELAKKYLLIDTENFRTQVLSNIIYISYPLYTQNYLLADMIASQIHKTLEEKFGKEYAFNKDVGEYLIHNFYSNGEYFNWNQRLIKGTGKPLDIETYFDYYNIK